MPDAALKICRYAATFSFHAAIAATLPLMLEDAADAPPLLRAMRYDDAR